VSCALCCLAQNVLMGILVDSAAAHVIAMMQLRSVISSQAAVNPAVSLVGPVTIVRQVSLSGAHCSRLVIHTVKLRYNGLC